MGAKCDRGGQKPGAGASSIDFIAPIEPLARHGEIGRGRSKSEDRGSHRTSIRGETSTYLAARLNRDRPDIAAQIDENAARNFMRAAERFPALKSTTDVDLSIDASALYLLSRDQVPQEVRDEAIEKAEAGERLTKEVAGRLIADRVVAALNEAREAGGTRCDPRHSR